MFPEQILSSARTPVMEIRLHDNLNTNRISNVTFYWPYQMISSAVTPEFIFDKLEGLFQLVNDIDIDKLMVKEATLLAVSVFLTVLTLVCICICKRKLRKKKSLPEDVSKINIQTYKWSVFDLAKTAYEPGHTEAVISLVQKLHYDVNSEIPSNGLTLFLISVPPLVTNLHMFERRINILTKHCACLSGRRDLIKFMIAREYTLTRKPLWSCLISAYYDFLKNLLGADVQKTTKAGDTALYLATFGILSSPTPDIRVLEDLILAGCDVNQPNKNGYIALHRAAGHGNLKVIQMLLSYGADPYQVSVTGIYPMDSAINAGNMEAAALLKIKVTNPYVWDVVEPHTPSSIRLGLQSPHRKHLMESSRRIISPKILSQF